MQIAAITEARKARGAERGDTKNSQTNPYLMHMKIPNLLIILYDLKSFSYSSVRLQDRILSRRPRYDARKLSDQTI